MSTELQESGGKREPRIPRAKFHPLRQRNEGLHLSEHQPLGIPYLIRVTAMPHGKLTWRPCFQIRSQVLLRYRLPIRLHREIVRLPEYQPLGIRVAGLPHGKLMRHPCFSIRYSFGIIPARTASTASLSSPAIVARPGDREDPALLGRRIAPRPADFRRSPSPPSGVTREVESMSLYSASHDTESMSLYSASHDRGSSSQAGFDTGHPHQFPSHTKTPATAARQHGAPRYRPGPSNTPSNLSREYLLDQRQERSPSGEERFEGRWSPLPEEFQWNAASRMLRQERITLEERKRRQMRSTPSQDSQSTSSRAQTQGLPAHAPGSNPTSAVSFGRHGVDAQPPTDSEVNYSDYLDFGSQRSSQQQETSRRLEEAQPGGSQKASSQTRQPSSRSSSSSSSKSAGSSGRVRVYSPLAADDCVRKVARLDRVGLGSRGRRGGLNKTPSMNVDVERLICDRFYVWPMAIT